jgi:hypothetical protein
VIKTQQEVADLIKQHSKATSELEELKKSCTDEVGGCRAGRKHVIRASASMT